MQVLLAYAAPVEGERVAARFPDALEVGVGKAAAAAMVALALGTRSRESAKPGLVLLFGVCGAYPSRHVQDGQALGVGDLCLVGTDCLADEGKSTDEGFGPLGSLGSGESGATGSFTGEPELMARTAKLLGGVPVVGGSTVSTCSGTEASSQTLARRTGAKVETMEGAAVALVCQRLSVPLVQLRCVSNYTGSDPRWELDRAAARVQEAVLDLLGRGWP